MGTKLRNGSTPALRLGMNSIFDTYVEGEDEIEEPTREFKRERMDDDISNDVFTFEEDEELAPIPDTDFDNTWEMEDVDMDEPSSDSVHSELRTDLVVPSSLPKLLTAEPMKEPRTMVSIPTNSLENALAAPFKKTAEKKKTKKSTILNFFNSRKNRRSSAVDTLRGTPDFGNL